MESDKLRSVGISSFQKLLLPQSFLNPTEFLGGRVFVEMLIVTHPANKFRVRKPKVLRTKRRYTAAMHGVTTQKTST